MTSDEGYALPVSVFHCRDPKSTAMDAFTRFAEEQFPGREWDRLSCGGYRFRNGERIYRVKPFEDERGWLIYIDFDAMKGVTA